MRGFFNKHDFRTVTHLPSVDHPGVPDGGGGEVKVGVGKHDGGSLAAEFQVHTGQRTSGLFHDALAHINGPGHGDQAHIGVSG